MMGKFGFRVGKTENGLGGLAMKDFTKLDRLLQEFADNSVPGCSCSIMQGDQFLYEGTAGYADGVHADARKRRYL